MFVLRTFVCARLSIGSGGDFDPLVTFSRERNRRTAHRKTSSDGVVGVRPDGRKISNCYYSIMPAADFSAFREACANTFPTFLRQIGTTGYLAMVLFCSAQSSWAGSVIFYDEADHTGRWTTVNGASPSMANLPAVSPPYLALNNGVIRTDLFRPVDGSWTLSFKASHSSRQRALWAGVFNENGTQGYGVLWDSALSGTGVVTLRKFDLTGEPDWASSGSVISPGARSGHNPIGGSPLAQFELEWDAPTRTLSLYVDGVLCAQEFDNSFHAFQRIYLRGNTISYFDDITFQASGPTAEVDERFYDLSGVYDYEGDPALDYHQVPPFRPSLPALHQDSPNVRITNIRGRRARRCFFGGGGGGGGGGLPTGVGRRFIGAAMITGLRVGILLPRE